MRLIALLGAIIIFDTANADTGRYRIMFGNDPSTEMTIGFDAYTANTNPVVYYSTNPINTNNLSSYSSKTPDATNSQLGMETCFVRLTSLLAGQTYYFVVKDNSGTSQVYNFETIPNSSNTSLSIIAGGDSRNYWDVRQVANKIVSKLQAHALMFDGDFTNDAKANEWQQWLDDWQLTISTNNRLTPIIPARGNHEDNNDQLVKLFDCDTNVYYTKKLGNNLIDIYTLNSTLTISGTSAQTTWFENELTNSNSIWKFAQYHHPIRPHFYGKLEGAIQYAYWADLFYQYGVDAVLEGDAHTVKTTWPLIPCSGGFDCFEGFKRDDINGTVYLGEGSYAAPLRPADDKKPWTRDSGEFHQFKWILVNQDQMDIRTVKYDANTNTNTISELPITNRFTIPQNLEIWDSSNGATNGAVVTLYKSTSNIPVCTLTVPDDNGMYFNFNNITLSANASGTSAISQVQFYVNGAFEGAAVNAPYELNWQPASDGDYTISAIAKDVNGLSSSIDFSTIRIGAKNNLENCSTIDIGSDEYNELDRKVIPFSGTIYGYISDTDAKLRICEQEVSLQGLRFKEINIPPNAIIESANIVFTPKSGYGQADVTIWCENTANSLPFLVEPFNLTSRVRSSNSLPWNNIKPWGTSTIPQDATTPDLKTLVQDLVELPDWTIESPITFLLNGSGERSAVPSRINRSLAPKLCVQFSIPNCPNPVCNDGNPNTINDTYDQFCRCIGELAGCTDVNACNYDSNAEADDNSCTYPLSPCDDGDPNTANDVLDNNCFCIGDDSCPPDIVHSGILSSGNYIVSNSIISTATVNQNQNVIYDAGASICLDKGFLADSDEDVFLLAKIEGCSQLREGSVIEQMVSIKNYPNPFTGETTIEFEVQQASKVSLIVTDVTGKVVAAILQEATIEKGTHQFRFDGDNLAQGIYYSTLIANDQVSTQKMMLMN